MTKPQSRTIEMTVANRNSLLTSKLSNLTKKSQLVRVLSKEVGADITISKKFGWQPHTTRAKLSRLRNSGNEISSMNAGTGKPHITTSLQRHQVSHPTLR